LEFGRALQIDENSPEKELEKLIKQLGQMSFQESGLIYALKAQIQANLARQLSKDMNSLSGVIGASANQVVRGTNVIKEAIERFDASATADVDKLSLALDKFRK
jgi:hypothetical protein